jgi:integrase/recombinase XerD
MKWAYWICLYTQTHCIARGLRPGTIEAYRKTLEQFRLFVRHRLEDRSPDQISARDVLEYVEWLRQERGNGPSAVNRQVTILRNLYRAMVSMNHLDPSGNPMRSFPKIKPVPRKLPEVLNLDQIKSLLACPPPDTVLGLRDRAMLNLLYGTGIRASECAGLRERDADLEQRQIRVIGKGGHARTLPLNETVVEALQMYRMVRGPASLESPFFRSRRGRGISRGVVYERVRTLARQSRVGRISPHTLRHTFATHLVHQGVNLVTIRDLLGHRQITSTQLYLHVTARDLRDAAIRHPIGRLTDRLAALLPGCVLPFQKSRGSPQYG